MKARKRIMSRIIAFCLCCGLYLLVMPLCVKGAEPVSITVYHRIENEAIADVSFSIYRVAEFSADGQLELAAPFDEYQISLDVQDASDWKNLANTLASYCDRDNIIPNEKQVTDNQGAAVFGKDGQLSEGVYLILGNDHVYNGKLYDIQPIMLSLPQKDADGVWQNDVEIETKYEAVEQYDTLTVFKVWEDNNSKDRPKSVTVELVNSTDNTIYAEMVLSQENDWAYTWDDLPLDKVWKITEKEVPEGYNVSIRQEQNQIEVKNIMTSSGGETPPDKIIQTGTLWWPVPILAAAGMLFVLIGLLRRQKNG